MWLENKTRCEHTSRPSLGSNKRNQGSLEKHLILGLGQWIYKMSLEHFVPKGKCQKNPQNSLPQNPVKHNVWEYVKGTKELTEGAPSDWGWNIFSKKIEYYWIITQTLNIHKSLLTEVNDWIKKYVDWKNRPAEEFQVIYVDTPHS